MAEDNIKDSNNKITDVDFSNMTRPELEEYALKTVEKLVLSEAEAEHFRELYQREINRKYGRSKDLSGINDGTQISLFNEAEKEHDEDVREPKLEEVRIPEKPKKARKKKGHQKKNLPVRQTEYRLSEDEQVCPVCGEHLHEMKKVVREEIVVEPLRFHVERHVTHVYACRNCDKNGTGGTVIYAESPKGIFRDSVASSSLVAFTIDRKFSDSMPLYRQSQSLARFSLDISRQTLSNWVIKASERYFRPIYDRLKGHLVKKDIINADETSLMVIKGKKSKGGERAGPVKGYMWLYRSGAVDEKPIIIYEYRPGRKQEYPEEFLKEFSGYLQTDGYTVYRQIAEDRNRKAGNIVPVGCFAHLQRKFSDAKKAAPKNSETPHIDIGLDYCKRLFDEEENCAGMTPEERKNYRKKKSAPILEEFFKWLKHMEELVRPESLLGKAVTYGLNQEKPLKNYLLDGRLEMTNNIAERAIKPFVIGRKNFLFAFADCGAQSSSVLYSIVETARANGLNSYEYMKYVMDILSQLKKPDEDDIEALMPWSEKLPETVRHTETD